MQKLILIDGNAILHRAYHALPPLTTRAGEPINAVYGLVSMLLKIIIDLEPTHIAIAFDRKEKTFRQREYVNYQAHRPSMDEDLSSQFIRAKEFIQAVGIPIYEKAGFEADDVIGTISHVLGNNKDCEMVIVTGDRDILQLVNDKQKVRVYMPITGLSNAKLMTEKGVVEKMGVPANLIDDYKALVGDPSDNYPGVPGIGPKNAVALLEKYGTFENIYKNLNKIPESVQKKLKNGEESGRISKKLATIVKDVPVEFNLDDAKSWKVDSKKVLDLFSEYGFRTLTQRVKEVGETLNKQKQMSLL